MLFFTRGVLVRKFEMVGETCEANKSKTFCSSKKLIPATSCVLCLITSYLWSGNIEGDRERPAGDVFVVGIEADEGDLYHEWEPRG